MFNKKAADFSGFFVTGGRRGTIQYMEELTPQVNLKSAPVITRVGGEQTPVIVIDDFLLNVSDVVNHACRNVDFEIDRISKYPGVRAALPKQHVIAVLNPLLPMLYSVYGIPKERRPRPKNQVYSLVSFAAEDLQPKQRVPHADSSNPYYFPITHYLNDGKHGGTGIFRHIPTGFENITTGRLDEYVRSADGFIAKHGDSLTGYITASNEHYELVHVVDYKPNRVVIYPGSLLHSGMIEPATDISPDPETGRLTANIFVNFE